MNNKEVYELAFHNMYNRVKDIKEESKETQDVVLSMERPMLEMFDDNSQRYHQISKSCQHSLIMETENLIMRLFTLNNISYEPILLNEKYKYFPFVRMENDKRIGYIFSSSMMTKIDDWKELEKEYNLDGIKVIAIVDIQNDTDTLNNLIDFESFLTDQFVTYHPIKELFSLIGDEEYSHYKVCCEKFNREIRQLIGYSTVTIPSDQMMKKFKENTSEMLKQFDYNQHVSEFYESQTDILDHNYFDKELYRAVLGSSNFAESFIGSEWYYSMHNTFSNLEKTGIIAGYLKTIEQLLYKIVLFSKNTGKTIKRLNDQDFIDFTDENLYHVDLSLGSLIRFVRYYSDLWEVNEFVRYSITDKLTEYRTKYRNDLFHKDNIFDVGEIEEIRENTIVLVYLLLGAFKMNENQIEELKLYYEEPQIKENLKYEQLEKWLTRILGGDSLLDSDASIYFMLKKNHGQGKWGLQFVTCNGFKESGFPIDSDHPYINNGLYWPAINEEEDTVNEIVQYIEKYLDDGKHAIELKGHPLIATGKLGNPKIIYQK